MAHCPEADYSMLAPADSSDESDFRGDIPFKKEGKKQINNDASDDESDSGIEDEEYIVDQILGHEWKDDKLYLVVKWKGYEDPEDHTLEPEENLDNAKIAVQAYFKKIGGRPSKPEKKKRKNRASTAPADKKTTPEPPASKKKAKPSSSRASTSAAPIVPDWVPKGNNWEQHVESIDTIMRDPDDPTGPLFVYLNWTNGNKSRVSTQQANQKCPQKMLQFYEQHIVFKENPDGEES